MFNCHRKRALFFLKSITAASPTPKCYLLLQRQHHPSPMLLSLKFCTTTAEERSFRVSYLIDNCGFSPETALKASKRLRFRTAEKPDSVLNFFRNYGFSNPETLRIISRVPELLACDPYKRVLPKFEFLLSKGASTSDVVVMVNRSPRFLRSNLEHHIIPAYGLARRFCQSDKKAIARVMACPAFVSDARVAQNIKLLLDNGVTESNIYRLLRARPSIFCSSDFRKSVEEVRELGFSPLQSSFSVALLAKRAISKAQWDEKVDAFKSWGWSEEAFLDAFRRHPNFMLRSKDKLNAVMRFWANQHGWETSVLRRAPAIFGFSLEKRIMPRASVIQYLLSKGLRKKSASLVTPLTLSEELFLKRFVKCFKEEETSQLLKLYQEKLNLQDNRGMAAAGS